jgi:hypothetical protein
MLAGGFAATLLLALLTSILALLLLGCLGCECCGCGFAANCCYQALPKKKKCVVTEERVWKWSAGGGREEGGREGGPLSNISYKYFIQKVKGLVF